MIKKWTLASAILAANLICVAPAMAAPVTFNFTTENFTDVCSDPDFDTDPTDAICTSGEDNSAVNTITGTFVGEDLNGDGYLSSFIFAQPSEMEGTGFTAGYNEITSASFTVSGPFIEGVPGFLEDPIISHTVTHDLTDITDEMFGLPVDFFFLLNYDLTSGGFLGDGEFEGMFMGTTTIFYALGQFLPSPIPVNTLTENLILNGNPAPCVDGNACGVLHSLAPDLSIPSVQRTSNLAVVSQVSAPSMLWLFAGCFFGLALLFNKHSKLP